MYKHLTALFSGCLLLANCPALASGVAIDKIYTPYVEQMEHELEYRAVRFEGNGKALDNTQKHKLAYGQALSERWFGELYITGLKTADDEFKDDGYEAEAKWQATEQGEFAFDVGLLFEIEREKTEDIWEASTALLLTRELGPVTFTSNIFLIFENGPDIGSEAENAANFQFLYRLSPEFEPAIEIYRAENTLGIGPMLTGTLRIQARQKLHWEFGIIAGMLQDMPDTAIKGLLEYEF